MKIDLITRNQIEIFNKRGQRYPLQDAEKDYFLAIILKIIFNSPLKNKLVFKGGTALYHCYLEQLRFSKDLDFTSLGKITKEDIEKIFAKYDFLTMKDFEERKYSLVFSLQYRGPLVQPNSIEININTHQKVLLHPKKLTYRNSYQVDVTSLVMDIKEIAAEKLRTLNERAEPRDLYDLAMLRKKFDIDFKKAVNLLRKKELHRPLAKKGMMDNLRVSLERFDEEIKDLYYKEPVTKKEIEKLASEILEVM